MSDIAIRAEHLSKQYKIGLAHKRHDTLRDALTDGVAGLFRRNGQAETREDTIWALDDVSFEVQRGDVVGVIGRNGAGKSTLLKILSRITKPTRGHAEVHGRVGSLLEVGTGFHGELTGRENIYLNGAILGMKRAEIDHKFDEIVAFAEVEKFIDTPVKRYSSGMYVRLAFAVAAHLEPEILMVDEVLAVGDAAFQKKCLGKMEDISKEGRTVLFVSHNISALLELCSEGILLDQGRLLRKGDVASVAKSYRDSLRTSFMHQVALREISRPPQINCHGRARLLSVEMPNSTAGWNIEFGETISFKITFETYKPFAVLELGIGLFVSSGPEVCSILSSDSKDWNDLDADTYSAMIRLPNLRLLPGSYQLGIGLRSEDGLEDYVREAVQFDIGLSNEAVHSRTHYRKGILVPDVEVNLEKQDHRNVPMSEFSLGL